MRTAKRFLGRGLVLAATALLAAVPALPQTYLVAPATLADITGTSAAVQIYSTGGSARWVLFIAPTANASVVRCGDSNVSASRGAPIAAGAGLLYPSISAQSGDSKQPLYNLGSLYCYIASGDKVSVSWAN